MNRRYTVGKYLELIDYARARIPDLVITSDIIVGFPGETEEDFQKTLDLIEYVRYDSLFTFLYSPRVGTPAASMEDPATPEEKQARFNRLLEAQNRISQQIHEGYIGKTLRLRLDDLKPCPGYALSARTDGGRLVHGCAGEPAENGRGRFHRARVDLCAVRQSHGEWDMSEEKAVRTVPGKYRRDHANDAAVHGCQAAVHGLSADVPAGRLLRNVLPGRKTASAELDLTLTGRQCGLSCARQCAACRTIRWTYVARLIARGYKVAICDQTEDPATAKGWLTAV